MQPAENPPANRDQSARRHNAQTATDPQTNNRDIGDNPPIATLPVIPCVAIATGFPQPARIVQPLPRLPFLMVLCEIFPQI
jgi:hypothetical protein